MACRRCASPLERPGDYCLVCDTSNADTVVLEVAPERATMTILHDESVAGTTTVTTVSDSESRLARAHRRNLAGRIADTVRRKRPEAVYATGERELVGAVRSRIRHEVYRVPADDPVAAAMGGGSGDDLLVVDVPPGEKIGGAHSTVIGDRDGRTALQAVAAHPHVKKIVPGPIDAGGNGSRGGFIAKVTRSGTGGNMRLLLRDGSTVQETRVITTAADRDDGERIRADVADALADAGVAEG